MASPKPHSARSMTASATTARTQTLVTAAVCSRPGVDRAAVHGLQRVQAMARRTRRGPIVEQLVRATRARHREFERSRFSRALLGLEPGLGRRSYAALLEVMLALSEELEAAAQAGRLDAIPRPCRPDPDRRALLIRDLVELGCGRVLEPTLREAIAEARATLAELLVGDERSLGWQYIWQGSTLGGEVIAPRVDELLDLRGAATSWYRGDPDKRAVFARLCVAIEVRVDAGLADHDRIIAGADQGFAVFERLWLTLAETLELPGEQARSA